MLYANVVLRRNAGDGDSSGEAGDQEEHLRAERYRERAKEFAQTFIAWFDEEGKAIPFGRSQTYRFAQGAFWSMCAMAEVECLPLGVIRGMIGRHLRYWMEQPIFDNGGVLTIGYAYPNLNMSEGYNASGSPYWALKSFAFLALPADHAFWQTDEAPFPEQPKTVLVSKCDMLLCHQKNEVVALTAGQASPMLTHGAEKYAKFAYSSRFGFSVPRSYSQLQEAGADSMLAFWVHGMIYVRRECMEYRLAEDVVYSKWSPLKGIVVETWLKPIESGHIRHHRITSELECVAYDCGFSYPDCQGETTSQSEGGIAIISDANGMSRVTSETGKSVVIHCIPNTNLIFPVTKLPAVEYKVPVGETEYRTVVETRFAEGSVRIGRGNCYELIPKDKD
jgi:hypothetical protein